MGQNEEDTSQYAQLQMAEEEAQEEEEEDDSEDGFGGGGEHSDAVEEPDIFEVEVDAYGLLFMRLVHYVDHHAFSNTPVLSVVHAAFMWCLNFVMQLGVTIALLYLAEDMESDWDNAYFLKHFNTTMDDAAQRLYRAAESDASTPPHVDSLVLEKCREAVGAPRLFYGMLMYLWLVKNFSEIEESVIFFLRLSHVARRSDESEHLFDEAKTTIERLDGWLALVLLVACPVVKILIAGFITYAGMKFLILQRDELTIILKALCMRFVTNIDNLLIRLATTRTRGAIRKVRIRTLLGDPGEHPAWDSGLGGLFYIGVTFGAVYYVLDVLFGDIVHFRHACSLYHESYPFEGVKARTLSSWFGVASEHDLEM